MTVRILIFFGLTLLAAGCASQVPLATNHPISTQKKAKAVHHWDVLADDVTTQTIQAMRKSGVAEGTPLYVEMPADNSTFAKAFRTLLITRMVGRGLPVTNEKIPGAIGLEYETQLVRHNSSRYAHVPGTFTTLGAGIWVIRDMIIGSTPAMPAGLAVGALADYGAGHFAGGATPTELLITSSMAVDKKYVMRKSDIYYIEDADVSLFVDKCKPEEECTRQLFADEKTPLPRPVKEIRVKEPADNGAGATNGGNGKVRPVEVRALTATCERLPCQPTER